MARGELTPNDIEIRQVISNNINDLLKQQGRKQIDIHRATGIPKSTLTGYVKGTTTPAPGNVQKLANFFNVKKSDIDPRFSSQLKQKKFPSDINGLYQKLTPSNKKNVSTYIEALLQKQLEEQINEKKP